MTQPEAGGVARDVAGNDAAPGGADTIQIGIAVDIPEPWGGMLTRRRVEAGDPAAVPAHVTLLGPTEIPVRALPAVEEHLDRVAAAHLPFTLHLRGTGTFRPVTQVVFVAVAAGISECELLAAAINSAPELRRELRFPYHPHVTVAQDVPPEVLDKAYEDLADFSALFQVEAFTLFSHSGATRWQPRRDFRLGGAS
ncbi:MULTISPECIES: 2'-5' RNA ligase family protein [Micromonospora]|uniref:2'-5' RNA ligase family protein n=2 Tax=Micromonospora chalcea TaxID=1874 RepID=A0ABX9Y448_MICCH|nr:2'-5' RNA ligase family protein [Micromonospora chalcea]MBP1780844.1 2'-5' RNA ligase [Micromonospora sp. HB375]MBQ1061052.1 2'-5' RNA ligase family protein [Micromonospora sp. C41]MDH6469540.1 2'-5' RNA ligase [Micromonospora sp. H404/HB375]NHO80484.1 2'-5' RNA ligase family protein [Micromonospora sp. CMU55-4]ODB81653.1 phosphoesterase [Micromonospora sp. II]RBQ13026.1 2'-5' RNA ligase family protein [Micromonospora sp. LHW51205]